MFRRLVASSTLAAFVALPLHAQAPAAPAAAAPAAAASAERAEEPSVEERRLVAYVSTGVAVASLATGITMGVLAQQQFDCAKDILACNAGLQNKVVGEEFFDVRAEIEQKALFADMAYLFAAAATVVATVGYLRGFVFLDEEPTAATATLVMPRAPVLVAAATKVSP